MIRWLGIHYKFPPVATVSSRRLFLLYQALEQISDSQQIISSAATLKRPQETAYQHTWPVKKVAGRGLREYLYGSGRNTVPVQHKQRPGYRSAVRLRETYPFQYYLGEGGPIYRREAFRAALRLVEQQDITHLFSSFRPWTDHLVASRIKARFPHLQWIADFRDLPIDPLRNPPYGLKWHKRLLEKRLRLVDQVWTVSQGLARELTNYHPRVAVVPSGLSGLPSATDYQADRFTINYSGSIYPGLQRLDPLIGAIQKLDQQGLLQAAQIKLQYAGKDAPLFRHWVNKSGLAFELKIRDQLPLDQALALQANCHLNLLLSWSAEHYQGILTAKLYDYLAAGRPILALINGPEDPELRAIIEESRSGRVFWSDDEERSPKTALSSWFLKQFQAWQAKQGRLPWKAEADKLVSLQPLPILRQLLLDPNKNQTP
ncbi:MAG: hypothetical protein AAF433_10440 [Bacteroidota bacterium]